MLFTVGLDLGLYQESRAINWRRRLDLLWWCLDRWSLKSWQGAVICCSRQWSFEQFSTMEKLLTGRYLLSEAMRRVE